MPERFPPEFKRDVVTVGRRGDLAVAEVVADLDISVESVRRWMRQADIDDGVQDGLTTAEQSEWVQHRWAPKGFHNQFEMPGDMPVTPGDVGPARGPQLDPADPFKLLPLNRDFHINRLKAVIHRNGVTAADISSGYFERDDSVEISDGERAAYAALGIPI